MKHKLLELLNAKFLGKGTRKDTLERLATAYSVQCTTEEEAQALVDKLEQNQVTEFEKEYRSAMDSEISKATKTALENAGKGKGGDEGKGDEGKGGEQPTDIASIVANAIKEATTPLLQEINSIKAGKTTETRLQQLNNILNDAKDETFKGSILKAFNRISFDSEDAFVEYLTEVTSDVTTSNQSFISRGLARHQPGAGSEQGGALSDADYDKMVS